jgi:hypothetical protein
VLGDRREIGERDANTLDAANHPCHPISNLVDEASERLFAEVPGILAAFGGNAKRSHPPTVRRKRGLAPSVRPLTPLKTPFVEVPVPFF